MKIRNGFVSNSSSSSFIIFGVMLDGKTAMRKFFGIEDGCNVEGCECEGDPQAHVECITLGGGLSYIYDYDCPALYIGVDPWGNMKEDETKVQFRQRIKDAINNRFPGKDIDVEVYDGVLYN